MYTAVNQLFNGLHPQNHGLHNSGVGFVRHFEAATRYSLKHHRLSQVKSPRSEVLSQLLGVFDLGLKTFDLRLQSNL